MLQALSKLTTSFTRKRHYGWVIFALTGANLTVEGGMKNSVPVIFVALRDGFGRSAAATSAVFSASGITGGLVAPLVGWLLDRLGPKRLFPVAGLVILAGYLLGSYASDMWQLFIFYSLVAALGETTISSFTATATLAPWFPRTRGRVLGLADAGNPLGQGIFAPLAQILISFMGWRLTFRILGLVFFLMVSPANFLLQRRPPAYEAIQAPLEPVAAPESKDPGQSVELSRTMRRPAVWFLVLARMSASVGISLTTVHLVAFFIAAGYSGLQAAATIGAVGVVGMVGRPISGTLSDYLGRELVYTAGLGMHISALVLVLLFGDGASMWPIIVFVGLSGLSDGVAGLVVAAKAADIVPSSNLGSVMGVIQLGRGVGFAAGPVIGGLLYDLQGDYLWAFSLAVAMSMGAILLMWAARFASPRQSLAST
ncbi:MAG: hypothetical protein BZY80_05685 [SAR202 cluster bacterium Io17-Chloro-G2]|nr:MAG: hypothetical protein BZY80_05685 [SAR202 cluster bacterium Io17-Chloro-G2]